MAAITQTTVLQDMSYLLGELSVPTSGIEDRQRFIQRALERIYRAYNFEDVKAIATVSLTNGVGTLPSDMGFRAEADVRVINSGSEDDYIFTRTTYDAQDSSVKGDYVYWITGSEGSYTFNSKETDTPAITVRYTQTAPSINASISTTFPSSMVIARGALVYYRQSENPQADIAQDEALFQQELSEIIAQEIRNKGPRRGVSIQELAGRYTGEV